MTRDDVRAALLLLTIAALYTGTGLLFWYTVTGALR